MPQSSTATAASLSEDTRRYPGVRSFEEQDRLRFFGRSRAAEELLLRVLSVRLLLQFAPSGVGKTSLLNAGLFPRLRDHNFFPVIVRLNQAGETLTQAVRRSLRDGAHRTGLQDPVVPEDAATLWELLGRTQLWSPDLLLLTPVLVFDQFEEVFTLRDEAFRTGVALEIGALSMGRSRQVADPRGARPGTDVPSPDVKIIISLREEYLGKLEEFSASIPDLFHERLRLSPLTAAEAREAIVEPAKMEGDAWLSPAFGFEESCLDALIDFIDGAQETAKVIEPVTLQLVCQQAEVIASERAARDPRPSLTLNDFGGLAGLEALVENFFATELRKVDGARTQKRARQMFEQGLLDPTGKRLMLEEGEIQRRYGIGVGALNTLIDSRLLRREPRNESVFYEISHDRLTEAIAKNRKSPLPRWVVPTIAAGAAVIVVAIGVVIILSTARIRIRNAQGQAEKALGVLLKEELVGRLREVGLTDAMEHVLAKAHDDIPSDSQARALSLRHEGDIAIERGTVRDAREKFQEALAALESLARGGTDAGHIAAERARTLKRLGSVHVDTGEVSKAAEYHQQSVKAWEQVLSGTTAPQEVLDASDSLMSLGLVQVRMGDPQGGQESFTKALRLAMNTLAASLEGTPAAHRDSLFDQGRAMQIYADAALSLANMRLGESESRAAHQLARESLRLRPLSSSARTQVGVAAATYGRATLYTSNYRLAPALFVDAARQFDELRRWDPDNRRLQRESAAAHLLTTEGTAMCAETAACKETVNRAMLEDAEIATVDSLGKFRELAGLDPDNRSLQEDVAWGLQAQARILSALHREDKALRLLDEAAALYRPSGADARDIAQRLMIPALLRQKAAVLARTQPLEALASLDAAGAETDRLPQKVLAVMEERYGQLDARIPLLKKLGRTPDAKAILAQRDQLLARIEDPWKKKQDLATERNSEGVKLFEEASSLSKRSAADALREFRKALEQFKTATAEYPFHYTYWNNQLKTYQWIRSMEEQLHNATASADASKNPPPARTGSAPGDQELEATLRAGFTPAWMARVLSDDEHAAASLKAQYEMRRSLIQFLQRTGRTEEGLSQLAEAVLEAEEYASQKPAPNDALYVLSDSNAGLGIVLWEVKRQGWEEAFRRALEYRGRLAQLEPAKSEHQAWIGGFREELGSHLHDSKRPEAAAEEFRLGVQACRQALRVAAAAEERSRAQSCLEELATLGYQ